MEIGALSHLGKVRTNNEDQFLVARFGRSMEVLSTSVPEGIGPDPEIERSLTSPGTADAACRDLVEKALAAGGVDNVTLVLGRYGAAPAP